MVQIRHVLLGERRLGIEVAHVEGALNVMLDARPSVGDGPHGAGNAAATRGANASASLAIDDQLLALGVPPDRGLEGLQLVPGQVLLGLLPDLGGFRHVGITVKGRKVLGHGYKRLHRHAVPPLHMAIHARARACTTMQPAVPQSGYSTLRPSDYSMGRSYPIGSCACCPHM